MTKRVTFPFHAPLVRATGSPAAAIVLSKVFYWCNGRLRVKRRGSYWLAKSQAQMSEETGLSFEQQKDAVTVLKKKGLIITEQGVYGNRNVRHIRLTDKGRALFKECFGTEFPHGPDGTGQVGPNGTGQGGPKGTAQGGPKGHAHSTQGTTAEGQTTIKQQASKGHDAMDSKQTVKNLQGKQSTIPVTVFVKNAAVLAMWWERLVPHFHDLPPLPGGLKMKPLTVKEKAILGKYLKAVGSEVSYSVMCLTIAQWDAFRLDVQETKGETAPTLPTVGALLRYYDIAVGRYQKAGGPGVKLIAVNAGNQKFKTVL